MGIQSVVWDEAVKINGADPDFHRRDLYNAIEMGDFPEWELGVQLFTEEEAEGCCQTNGNLSPPGRRPPYPAIVRRASLRPLGQGVQLAGQRPLS